MKYYNLITNEKQSTLDIFGEIGTNMFGEETPNTIKNISTLVDELSALNTKELIININSPGGDVNDALVIYDKLLSFKGKKVVNFIGLVASAASVIGMAGDQINMSENGMLLIHKAMTGAAGNVNDLQETIDTLKIIDDILVNIYVRQTGDHGNARTIEKLMNENNGHGRFLNAEEAQSYGLIDKIQPGGKIFNMEPIYLNSLTKEQLDMLNEKISDMSDDECVEEIKNFL